MVLELFIAYERKACQLHYHYKVRAKNNLHFLTDLELRVIPSDSSVQELAEHEQYLEKLKKTSLNST